MTLPIKKELLDQGSVELLQSMGTDLNIVNAARCSFDQQSSEVDSYERGLISFLMKNSHGSPFEMVEFLFRVKCPIKVAREWFRHRVGVFNESSFNEVSTRYKKVEGEFYIPLIKDLREQHGKPGNYQFKPLAEEKTRKVLDIIQARYEYCWQGYEELLAIGLAKEQASLVLNLGLYTTFWWKVNLRSLLNFISLRSHETAMYEIRVYSQAIEEMIKDIVPEAYKTFIDNGRIQP